MNSLKTRNFFSCSFILILLSLHPKLTSGLDQSKPTRQKIIAIVRQAEQSLRDDGPEAAREKYQQALSILQSEDDHISAASIHLALGRILEKYEQFQQSLWHYERGIQILAAHRSAGMADDALNALRRMDKGYMESSGAPLSIDLYPGEIPELSLFLSKPDVPLLTTALLMNAGNMYLRQSQFRQADSLYLKALKHLNPVQLRQLKWQLQANLAWSALKSDRLGEAEVWLDSVMIEIPEHTASLDVRQAFLAAGVSLRERGEYTSSIRKLTYAIRLYEEARDPSGLCGALAHLGTAYFMAGDMEKARHSYEQALEMNRTVGDSETEWHANGGLARYYHRIGNLTAASRYYRQYVAVVNRIGRSFSTDQGKVSLLENHQQVFEDYARVELKLAQTVGHYRAAREAIEQLRDQTLLSLLEMNHFRRRLRSGHLDALKFIVSNSPRDPDVQSASGIFNPDLSPSDDVRQMAPYIPSVVANDPAELTSPVDYIYEEGDFDSTRIPAATFLEYFVMSDQLVILVKTAAGGVHGAVVDIDEASLSSAVTDFGGALGLHGPEAVPLLRNVLPKDEESRSVSLNELSRKLYEWLIRPVISFLPEENDRPLILVPHVNLWQLPFAALKDERGRYLCDRFLLNYAPSESVWKWLASQRRATDHRNPRAWIVGNPRMPQMIEGCGYVFEFTPLDGSQKEAEAIAKLFGPDRCELFIGKKADRLRLEAWHPDFSVLHLATHGFSCIQDPLRSFVILTALGSEEMALDATSGVVHVRGDDRFPVMLEGYQDGQLPVMFPYPGVLDAWTIIDQYHLNADLVTLSACQTGLGKFLSQGAIGFSRAFLKAGARSLLVSQWNVNDAATAELMIAFYREYLKHGHKALALQKAMKECRKHHPHPRDWAAFTLVGLAE